MRIRCLLIANRGEIAARLARTCRRLGIETVLAASEADLDSVPALLADRVVRLGPSAPQASYLSVAAVVAAATATGADAVHPGYGFLAESPALASACAQRGLVFVGPSAAHLRLLSDKVKARSEAAKAGLPVLPGGEVETLAGAESLSDEIGLPVLVKAAGGGGGRGMRLVREQGELAGALELASTEAREAFDDPRVYLERYVKRARHVEVQLLGDGADVVHAGDRDCSVQRRYQKLIEEAPAPDLPEELGDDMRGAAVRFARHLRYSSLGTVEFLVDPDRGEYYFLEVNPRIQVEHPVTEMVSGLDLVAEQLSLAEGNPLRLRQEEIELCGHAVECRVNAEDPARGFEPAPGVVGRAVFPAGEGIRVETALQAGTAVHPWYDSLVAKLVTAGADRSEAIRRLRGALDRCRIEGIATTLGLCRSLVASDELSAGAVDTGWLARFVAAGSGQLDGRPCGAGEAIRG